MPSKTMKIGDKRYPIRPLSSLARAEIKKLKTIEASAVSGDHEALWDMLGLLVTAPQKVVDTVGLGEVEKLLRESGIIEGAPGEPSLGESSASTDS